MDPQALLALLAGLDGQADDVLQAFEAELVRAMEQTAVELVGELAKIQWGRGGTLTEQRVARRQALEMQQILRALLLKGAYGKAVAALLQRTEKVVSGLGGYFGKVEVNFNPDRHLYKQVIADGRARLIEALTGSGLESKLVSPVVTTIYQQVSAGATLADTVKVVQKTLSAEGAPVKEAGRLASDGLSYIRADYIQTVSADLELDHFLYAGTIIAQSRKWCAERVGKAFSRNEVEAMAEGTWDGQIPGTDAKTIYLYRGGYRCRHQYYPISEAMYDYLSGQN